MPSIRDMITGSKTETLVAEKYDWREIYGGAKEIGTIADGKQIVGDVRVEEGDGRARVGYGCSLMSVTEGVLFSDGTVLVCATVREFTGTMATNDDVGVNYYELTPREKGDSGSHG